MNPSNSGFYAPRPPMMNPPPQLFAGGNFDPSQMQPGSMFHDDLDDHGDGGDPKRRRIARVYPLRDERRTMLTPCRPAICAARRRSNATARCPRAPTARTTRRNASLPRWKRRDSRQKGMRLNCVRSTRADYAQRQVHRRPREQTRPHGIADAPLGRPPRRRRRQHRSGNPRKTTGRQSRPRFNSKNKHR